MTRLKIEEDMKAIEEISRLAPELNPSNYDHADVCSLNLAMIRIYLIAMRYGTATAEVERVGGKQKTQPCVLADATKGAISQRDQALLQWDFRSNGFPAYSVQMPESVVDQILAWRDNERDGAEGGE